MRKIKVPGIGKHKNLTSRSNPCHSPRCLFPKTTKESWATAYIQPFWTFILMWLWLTVRQGAHGSYKANREKQSGGSSKTQNFHRIQQRHSWAQTHRDRKRGLEQTPACEWPRQHHSQQSEGKTKQPECPPQTHASTECSRNIWGRLSSQRKECSSYIHYRTDDVCKHAK